MGDKGTGRGEERIREKEIKEEERGVKGWKRQKDDGRGTVQVCVFVNK
jgi:hypothetical protein